MSKTRTITPNPPADFVPSKNDVSYLRPFRVWCQKVLPLVYDDSLSYYELLCKVVDYLNKTMEEVNQLGVDVSNLFNAFQQLQDYVNHYFDNLDVQEEINNKLDQMFEDGTLSNLFSKYMIKCFETTEDLIADTKLQKNMHCITLGYHSINDGGLSMFYITETALDSSPNILTDNGLYANLLHNGSVSVKQMGAYGDGINIDDDAISKILGCDSVTKITFPYGKYLLNSSVVLNKQITMVMDNDSELIANNNMECIIKIDNNMDKIFTISGGVLNGNGKANVGLGINKCLGCSFRDLIIEDTLVSGINTGVNDTAGASNLFENIYLRNNILSANAIGIDNVSNDNNFSNITMVDYPIGIKTNGGNKFYNVHPWINTYTVYLNSTCFVINGQANNFTDCTCDTYYNGFDISNSMTVFVSGNRFAHNSSVVPFEFSNGCCIKTGTSSHAWFYGTFFDISTEGWTMVDDDTFNENRKDRLNMVGYKKFNFTFKNQYPDTLTEPQFKLKQLSNTYNIEADSNQEVIIEIVPDSGYEFVSPNTISSVRSDVIVYNTFLENNNTELHVLLHNEGSDTVEGTVYAIILERQIVIKP